MRSFSCRVSGTFTSSVADSAALAAPLGSIPIFPKYLLLRKTNKSCPTSTPTAAAKKP